MNSALFVLDRLAPLEYYFLRVSLQNGFILKEKVLIASKWKFYLLLRFFPVNLYAFVGGKAFLAGYFIAYVFGATEGH